MKTKNSSLAATAEVELQKPRVVRFQVELLQSRLQQVAILMAKAGVRAKREFFDNAFSFLQWAIEETAAGHTVGVLCSDQKTLLAWRTPVLETARSTYETNKKGDGPNGRTLGHSQTARPGRGSEQSNLDT